MNPEEDITMCVCFASHLLSTNYYLLYTQNMRFLSLYFKFALGIFSWKLVLFHLFSVIITIFLVYSGLDWSYSVFVLDKAPLPLLYSADLLGFLIPITLLVGLLILSLKSKDALHGLYLQATWYAVILGLTLSMFIKMFTGRTSPPHHHGDRPLSTIDNSHDFNFGFLQEQIFGGWPSSHGTVMFALATTLFFVLPRHWYTTVILFSAALYVSIGVTFGFHWLSEFFAGASLGIATGIVVGFYFKSLSKIKS